MREPADVLLVGEGGDLDEIATTLRRLEVAFEEVAVGGRQRPILLPRGLLVASVGAALTLPPWPASSGSGPARIAVGRSDGRGLRAGLRAAGFDLLIRTPVHPKALELLLLRLLYRGPERRALPRVEVGLRVRVRQWLRWQEAWLAELSLGGCRLLAPKSFAAGSKIRVELPPSELGGRGVRVAGVVVRSNPLGPTDPNVVVAVGFANPSALARECIESLLREHRAGPAPLSEAIAPVPAPPSGAAAEPEPEKERRRSPRTRYRSRVVTLGERAAHVVIGRDLSARGLRIEPHGALELGQSIALALHGSSLPVPVVVRAHVARDDGEAGLLLRFETLTAKQESAVSRLMGEGSVIESLADEASAVLAEIVGDGARPAA